MNIQELKLKGKIKIDHGLKITSFVVSLIPENINYPVELEAVNYQIEKENEQLGHLSKVIQDISIIFREKKQHLISLIWENFHSVTNNSSYNMINYDSFGSRKEAHSTFFDVKNELDAFNVARLDLIYCDLDYLEQRFLTLHFSCPWEEEHGIDIEIIDGEIVN